MIFNENKIQEYFDILKNYSKLLEESKGESKIDITRIKQILDQDISIPKTEENLLVMCNELLPYKNLLGDKSSEVLNIQNEIVQYLRSFNASGIEVAVDPNIALILDTQNPDFIVTFKNAEGKIKRRKYALKIFSVGFKIELSIKVDVISIIGNNFNYYETNKPINLGAGIDIAGGWLGLTICKIEEFGCALLLFGVIFGISGAVSYVYKGTMTPIKE